MRVGLLTVGFLLTSVIASLAATVNMSPPAPVKAPAKVQAKVICPCNCPKDHSVRREAHRAPRRIVRHVFRHYAQSHYAQSDYAESSYYRYSAAAPVIQHDWHGQWRVAPNDAYIPGPQAYGPPHARYSQEDVQVDSRGWTGGVGDGGFVDGYGQVHFGGGGSIENGPTYNSYGQSFQYNPSQAGRFQPRSMGGYAPSHR